VAGGWRDCASNASGSNREARLGIVADGRYSAIGVKDGALVDH
jgi:hypothetical protein